jgi:hypothetical protein
MSVPVPSQAARIIDVPSVYVLPGTGNGRPLGHETDLIDKVIGYMRQFTRLEYPTKANVILAPETSESLERFSRLTDALWHLLKSPESDEFGPIRPTSESVELAINALFPLVQHRFKLPEAVDVGTDHDGGLRIVWENGPRFLELIVPYEHDAAAYFYYSNGDQYDLQRDLTVFALQARFNWLSAGAT